jgi:hypothetical protein
MMKREQQELRIPMQVGSELRIKNDGAVVVDNPELELGLDEKAADAMLSYRYDAEEGVHILRLLDPVADHQHLRSHRRDD